MVRFKNRWLLIEFLPVNNQTTGKDGLEVDLSTPSTQKQAHIEGKHIWGAIRQSVLSHFGDVGWGSVGLSLTVKYFSPTTHICIVRVARDHHKIAWGAVTMLKSIEGVGILPNVIHVSGPDLGTIKHAQLAAIEHNRVVVARYRAQAGAPAAYQDSYVEYLRSSEDAINTLKD
ncbi:RNA-binding protein pop5 [Marasmius crinis-equi]|uniref:RNA-binding protein pop5 n=1 Tax=Marasmius crinis-equi TaxID=585013 RepID=A0ABR3FNU4_9AGAR